MQRCDDSEPRCLLLSTRHNEPVKLTLKLVTRFGSVIVTLLAAPGERTHDVVEM